MLESARVGSIGSQVRITWLLNVNICRFSSKWEWPWVNMSIAVRATLLLIIIGLA